MSNTRQVIIGNSAAGLSASEAIRKIDVDCPITIISDEESPAYSRVLIPYYIGGRIAESQLFIRDSNYYRNFRVDRILGRVTEVRPEGNSLRLDNGSIIRYDNLLIATGASPRLPQIAGIDEEGVAPLRTLNDTKRILSYIKNGIDALIIGAGYVNLKLIDLLWGKGIKFAIVEIADQILAQTLDAEAASLVEKKLKALGIRVLKTRQVTRIIRQNALRKKIFLDNGEEVEADLVIIGVGVTPNVDLLRGAGVNMNRGVLIDRLMETNYENIFAAGDVAEGKDFISGIRVLQGTWNNAVEQGRFAGYCMAGVNCEYMGSISMNVAELFGLTFASIGLTRAIPDSCDFLIYSNPAREIYRKIVIEEDRIIGAILLGKISDAGVIHSLIRKKVNVSDLGKAIAKGSFEFGRATSFLWRRVW